MAWSEEGKLLEYHRGRGVFYPFIQVQQQESAPASAVASAGDDQTTPMLVVVAGCLLLVGYELGIHVNGSPVFRALLGCAILVLAVLSADRIRFSRKDPQAARGVERRLASLLGLDARPTGASTIDATSASQPVKALSWHPYLNRFAVALGKGHFVRNFKNESSEHLAFYDMDAEQWLPTVVKHEFQRAISCLQYQPHSGGSIAVTCQEGICLWNLEPAQVGSQASSNYGAETAIAAWMSWYLNSGHFTFGSGFRV